MRTLIALFRGINVGGKILLLMKELVAVLEGLKASDIRTYIQSGNVVFRTAETRIDRLSSQIGAAIRKRKGFEPHVLLIDPHDLEAAVNGNPFADAESDPTTLHVGFLATIPTDPDWESLESACRDHERIRLKGRFFYLHAPEGIARSKVAVRAENDLGVAMTVRNWRTVRKLLDMASQSE